MRLRRAANQHRQLSEVQGTLESLQTTLRRSVPRQPVDWKARFRFCDDPTGRWQECFLSDISATGCGLRVTGLTPEEVEEGRTIEVVVQVRGDVRNAVAGMEHDTRIGIQFADLSADAEYYVKSLKSSDLRW